MVLLFCEVNVKFNEKYLNLFDNQLKYSIEMKKVLNFGVYGIDFGYLVIFKQNMFLLKYLVVMEKIIFDLGLEGVFDKNFMSCFEKNFINEDFMMVIVLDVFKKLDNFLKLNDCKVVLVLIFVGGWVELMYIVMEINKEKNDQCIVLCIGEQQEMLNMIIEILEKYNKVGVNDVLMVFMSKLKVFFDKVMI